MSSMRRQPGDWDCGSCRHHNFSWRDSCQQCGAVKSTDGDSSDYAAANFRPGDWYCLCGGHNFASRSSCHFCGAPCNCSAINMIYNGGCNDVLGSGSTAEHGPGSGWKPGDWLCTRSGCNQHNFASRKLCYRCKAPKGMQETTTAM
ncbi:RNA-binding protein involved in heterochromatin assembly dri1-like [Curcuma longa]|uniref:RNA-binding protein involved in heterochromatin assembly dri1-like n=1 Tax=Curcuma longa TaxID=136217 RepID=UPI003D9DDB63